MSGPLTETHELSPLPLDTTNQESRKKKATDNMVDWVCDLPTEIWFEIFHWIDMKNLVLISQVCKSWRAISRDETLWQKLHNQSFAGRIEILSFASYGTSYYQLCKALAFFPPVPCKCEAIWLDDDVYSATITRIAESVDWLIDFSFPPDEQRVANLENARWVSSCTEMIPDLPLFISVGNDEKVAQLNKELVEKRKHEKKEGEESDGDASEQTSVNRFEAPGTRVLVPWRSEEEYAEGVIGSDGPTDPLGRYRIDIVPIRNEHAAAVGRKKTPRMAVNADGREGEESEEERDERAKKTLRKLNELRRMPTEEQIKAWKDKMKEITFGDKPEGVIGEKIAVQFIAAGEKGWTRGTVVGISKQPKFRFHIHYDDGDTAWVRRDQIQKLLLPIREIGLSKEEIEDGERFASQDTREAEERWKGRRVLIPATKERSIFYPGRIESEGEISKVWGWLKFRSKDSHNFSDDEVQQPNPMETFLPAYPVMMMNEEREERTPWECEICTFLNDGENEMCEVCGQKRRRRRNTTTLWEEWACDACTFLNRMYHGACRMCGTYQQRISRATERNDERVDVPTGEEEGGGIEEKEEAQVREEYVTKFKTLIRRKHRKWQKECVDPQKKKEEGDDRMWTSLWDRLRADMQFGQVKSKSLYKRLFRVRLDYSGRDMWTDPDNLIEIKRPEQLQGESGILQQGDCVIAQWTRGFWYPGTVALVNGGTPTRYTIHFEGHDSAIVKRTGIVRFPTDDDSEDETPLGNMQTGPTLGD